MRRLAFILFFFPAICGLIAQTNFYHPGVENYHCAVCGKGPLRETVYTYKWGVVCGDCRKLPTRCSICGLPVKDGDEHIVTGDGRNICRFDKTNCVLTVEEAQDIFEKTREEVVALFGDAFALKNTVVSVKLFDVDYWSEKGRDDGLHKGGFSWSRDNGNKFSHEVVMLSGKTREQTIAVAAHEYTHLWINENRGNHRIDGDTVEAICELTAYKLMQKKHLPEMQKQILENPYTHGQIKTLVAVEKRMSTDYVLNWVKKGKEESLDDDAPRAAVADADSAPAYSYVPRVLPQGLKFSGILSMGSDKQAVISGATFFIGDKKTIKLRNKSVSVRLVEIHENDVIVELNDSSTPVKLEKNAEKLLP